MRGEFPILGGVDQQYGMLHHWGPTVCNGRGIKKKRKKKIIIRRRLDNKEKNDLPTASSTA